MCKGSGGSTNTVTTSQQPFPAAVNAYTNANNWANYAANLGAQTYGGQLVATNPMLPGAAANTLNLSQDFVPFRDPALANLQAVPGYGTTAAGYGQTAADLASRYGGNAAANADWYAGQAYNYGGQAPGIAAGAGDAANTAAARGTDWANYGASAASNAGGTAEDFARSYGNQAAGYGGTGMGIAGGYGNQATAAAATAPGIAAGYGNQALTSAQGGMSAATGYGNAATRAAGSAPGLINTYLSPYTQNVVDATQAQFNNQNAIQNAGVVGNAAAQGAWGGDRSAVAQGIVAGQQQTAQAPVIAGLYQQGYQQAVQAAQQQAQLQAQTGVQAGQLGIAGAGLGATTALGAGQEGIAGAQLGAQTGIQAGQLGLAGTQQAAQAAEAAGQLGLGATGQQIQAGIQGGQLGVGAAGQRATTALGAGQLGIAGQQQATQAALGAAQQSTAANLGAGQLANQANLGAGQLNLGAGELNTAAAAGLGNLGQQNYNIDLGTLNAQIAAGGLEQQQQQAQLNVPYQQWLSAQAYPYQTAQFLANIAEGTGGLSGGTSSTTSPAASPLSQALGLGIGGAGLIGATGGFGANGWLTGAGGLFGPSVASLEQTPGALQSAFDTSFPNVARGGAVPHRQMGGIIPGGRPAPGEPGAGLAPGQMNSIGTGVPDVSMSVVPLGGGTRSPTILNPLASTGQTSTTSGGGSGGSQAVGDIGTAASLARLGLMIFAGAKDGGAVPHRQFGGSAPSYGIAPNPGSISPSFMPPDVSVSIFPQTQQQHMGSGPPRPPAPASVTASQGITPTSMLSSLKSIRDLSANGGIFSASSDMARGGGIMGYDEGGDVLDVHDVAGGSRSWADIAGDPGSPSGPAQFPSYRWYERAPAARQQVADAGDVIAPGSLTPPAGIAPAAVRDPEVKLRNQIADDMGIVPSAAIGSTMPSPSDYATEPYRPDPWLALAAAGFGAAAGRSPQAMQNLGAGGLEGLKFYEQERQVAPRLNLEQAQLGVIPSAIRLREAEATKAESEAALAGVNVDILRAQLEHDRKYPLVQQLLGNIPGAAAEHKEENAPLGQVIPFTPSDDFQKQTGITPAQYDTFRGYLAGKESPDYSAPPNADKHSPPGLPGQTVGGYMGRYQMGAEEIAGAASRLGMPVPSQQQFLENPQLQEQLFQEYTLDHHNQLMQSNPAYAQADPATRMALLAGAHLGGPGAIAAYQKGQDWTDSRGTKVSSYINGMTAALSGPHRTQVAQAGPSGSFTDAGIGTPVPFDPTVNNNRALYDWYQQQYQQYQQGIRQYQAGMLDIAQLPMNPVQKRQLLQQQQTLLQTQQANMIRLRENDPWMKAYTAGITEQATMGQQPQEYLRSDLSTGVAPRSQVMAGTAPGSLNLPGRGTAPATEGGKYDPTPESLVSAPPGTVKLADQDKEKLQTDQKELAEYRAATETTPQTIQRTQELGQILQTLKTGRILDAGHDLMAWARAAGYESLIPAGYDPSKAEMVNKLSTSLVFEQLKAIGGRPMVAEITGLQQANANKALTPQANLDIIGNIEGGARYTQDRYQQAQAVWNKYHQLGDFDAQYLKNSPLGQIFADTKKQFQQETPASRILGRFPDAQLAPDGKYYVQRGGKYQPVNLPE